MFIAIDSYLFHLLANISMNSEISLNVKFSPNILCFPIIIMKISHYGISSNGKRDTQLLTVLMNEAEGRASSEERSYEEW